jgi:hypothetical protein
MNRDQVARVLAKIQLGDNRSADALTLREWEDSIGHLDFTDAIAAVTMHRQESTDYLQPAHVITNARRIRDARPLPPLTDDRDFAPKPNNFEAMTEAYRSGEPHRIATELGKYNRQLVDAGRHSIPEWPLGE